MVVLLLLLCRGVGHHAGDRPADRDIHPNHRFPLLRLNHDISRSILQMMFALLLPSCYWTFWGATSCYSVAGAATQALTCITMTQDRDGRDQPPDSLLRIWSHLTHHHQYPHCYTHSSDQLLRISKDGETVKLVGGFKTYFLRHLYNWSAQMKIFVYHILWGNVTS